MEPDTLRLLVELGMMLSFIIIIVSILSFKIPHNFGKDNDEDHQDKD